MIQYLKKVLAHIPIRVRCLLCKGHSTADFPLCQYCLDCLPMTGSSCPACGIAMPTSIVTQCAKCIQTPLSFDCCLSAFVFSYPVNHIIQRIKYNQGTELISPLIPFLTNVLIDYYCARPWPEAIIPTPLHKKRMRSRGYNQSLLLAKAIHQALPINSACHLEEKSIYKHKETASQQNLPASARRKNIKGAFCVKNTIPFRHVAIVDDVVTTSETVSEISRVLKKTGVEQVDIWCLARTPRDNLIG